MNDVFVNGSMEMLLVVLMLIILYGLTEIHENAMIYILV